MEKSTLFNVPFSPLPDLYFKAYNLSQAAARLRISIMDLLQVSDAIAFYWLVSLDEEKISFYKLDKDQTAHAASIVNALLTPEKIEALKQKLSEHK